MRRVARGKLADMSAAEVNGGRASVASWLRAAPRHELLPPRRRAATTSEAGAEPLDQLDLGRGGALTVAEVESGFVVVPVADADRSPRRAVAGDGVFAAMLRTMRRAASHGAFRGEAFGGALDDGTDDEVAIDVDQSNDSVVVGGSAVVKLFPLTSPGPQPGLELPVHLAAVGFPFLPAPLGALRWTSPLGEDVVLATAASFLPGARDGWDWYLARLLGWLDGEADDGPAFGPAPMLGRIGAAMHVGFATASDVIPHPVSTADASTAAAWRRAALGVADEAIALTDGDEGARLAARADAIRAELEGLGDAAGTVMTRVHGDFHVGQVLEWRDGYAVTDFDGNPMAAPAERGAPDTPARDVAAFVRSIDHLGRVASTRRPGHDERIASWIETSRRGFLDAYRHELAERGMPDLFDERLLRPLEVAQECHEYVYAARFLPRWRYVPDLAIRALFPMEDR